jgi:hypothetical protein
VAQRFCPRTGRVLGDDGRLQNRWPLALTGLFSLVWFAVRVIPKPSRASYPCQRAAAPLAAGFVTWVMGLAIPSVLFRRARILFKFGLSRAHYVFIAAGLLLLASWHLFPYGLVPTANADGEAAVLSDGPLEPIGVGRGVVPGRVVWAHDPHAVSWAGQGPWWADVYNDQPAIDRMVSRSIRALAEQRTDADAWQAIFRYFNRAHGRGNVGYRCGERIAIKANLNNTTGHGTIDRLNTSAHLLLALVRQLTAEAGVAPEAITIFDSSRFVPQNLYDKIHREFAPVTFVDHIGGVGRIKAEFKADAIPFSVAGHNASGIDTTAIQATYLIDAALLKGHVSSGVTLCAKNLFGALSIDPDWHRTPTMVSVTVKMANLFIPPSPTFSGIRTWARRRCSS